MKNLHSSTVDVCIIGAGPGGLAAATELVDAGASVLVVDKSIHPGTKLCGGGITSTAWSQTGIPRDTSQVPFTSFNQLEVHTEIGSVTMNLPDHFMTVVDRKKWQEIQIERLRDEGAHVSTGRRFFATSGETVRLEGQDVVAGILIGSDGASSAVRRSLNIGASDRLVAWQTTVPHRQAATAKINTDAAAVRFDRSMFATGYGWIFPAAEGVRIGCGGPGKNSHAQPTGRFYRSALSKWLDELGLRPQVAKLRSASIPTDYRGHRFGRVRLVGDAAGLASPVTGEGISQALTSGREAAMEIINPSYFSKVIPALGKSHRRVAALMTGSPLLGSALLTLSPVLLRFSPVRVAAIEKFTWSPALRPTRDSTCGRVG